MNVVFTQSAARNDNLEICHPERSEGSVPVIPAEAGIQTVFELELKTNLDAGVRRHDEHSLRLKAGFR